MSDEPTAAPAPEAAELPQPHASKTDEIVDRWFGDYAIPNYFGAAKAELKKRLNAAS